MPPARRRRARYDSARYNGPHRVVRGRLDPVVQTGTVPCVRCGELIAAGTDWQLDHREDGRGWLGPAHQSCNARAGWEKMVASNGNRVDLQQPYRWSQRWYDDPPPGTTVNLGDGLVEIYIGRGNWQTIPAGSERRT